MFAPALSAAACSLRKACPAGLLIFFPPTVMIWIVYGDPFAYAFSVVDLQATEERSSSCVAPTPSSSDSESSSPSASAPHAGSAPAIARRVDARKTLRAQVARL